MTNGMENPPKILLVDDQPEDIVLLGKLLAGIEVETIGALSGDEALALAQEHDFALALVDAVMPEMDGFETVALMRTSKKTQNLPVIFLSAVFPSDSCRIKGVEAGAVDFLEKPVIPEILLGKVKIFLNLYNQRIALEKEIEKRIESELALRNSEERYEILVNTIPDIIYRIDLDGRFEFINDAVRALGYEQEELIGQHFSKIILPSEVELISRKSVLKKYGGVLTGDGHAPKFFDERRTGARKTRNLETRLLTKQDKTAQPLSSERETITAEINSSGLYQVNPGAARSIIGTVGVIRDISARKHSEQQLDTIRRELLRKEKLSVIGQLAASIAHDLRNPLGVISNSVFYLKTKLKGGMSEDEKIIKHFGLIHRELQRASAILSDLLDYTKISGYCFVEGNINFLLEDFAVSASLPQNVSLQFVLQPGLPDIPLDPSRMRLVFQNLLSNAIEAMPSGGVLEIATKRDDHSVAILFKDNGGGIPREDLEKIFEPLFTTKSSGIGLGLAIVSEIVTNHKGAVTVQSEEGKGALFTVTLPMA